MTMNKRLIILGTHGIPAQHGGFETFAEKLALHLVQSGWHVTVFGQSDRAKTIVWNGIECIYLKRSAHRWLRYINPVLYDLKAVFLTLFKKGTVLTLGYNTALFNIMLWGRRQIINMDGLEWKRSKYRRWHERAWLKLNEWVALKIADLCIADHTEIETYLRSVSTHTPLKTICYGADESRPQPDDPDLLARLNLVPEQYGLVIARQEPENQIFEIIQGWTRQSYAHPLVIVGNPKTGTAYHDRLQSITDPRIRFVGGIYEPEMIRALRCHAALYLHGHTVGGTNPSLVEAMGARCAIVAHDNPFNRGTARDGAHYFHTPDDLAQSVTSLLAQPGQRADLRQKAWKNWQDHFQWTHILQAYEDILN